MVSALVTSKLDYSLLYDSVDKNSVSFQSTAARLIVPVSKYTNITPLLKELHWLPVTVCFKIRLLVHRADNYRVPVYIVQRDPNKTQSWRREFPRGGSRLLEPTTLSSKRTVQRGLF